MQNNEIKHKCGKNFLRTNYTLQKIHCFFFQSVNQSLLFILKKNTVINEYNEIKLNKTNKILRNNLAYYLF